MLTKRLQHSPNQPPLASEFQLFSNSNSVHNGLRLANGIQIIGRPRRLRRMRSFRVMTLYLEEQDI
ncbi:hypothetical protein F5878DRAFT_667738 [Lentinula raphanica]|uniref:Uncharacterized protein n=1 Tax=Lentinula raphanica TaxID=153919 RepID=A0AA38U2V7_9AGAR|nr:hypothetical protein F5878DRAFT_667738 [Lentinula raphanica]